LCLSPKPDALTFRNVWGLSVCAQAALVIDKNTKLSVFATRPAIPSPLLNFVVEFLGTLFLIMGAELINFQSHFLYFPLNNLWSPFLYAWFVGWYIFLIVCGLGGPTGGWAWPSMGSVRLAGWLPACQISCVSPHPSARLPICASAGLPVHPS
jgi:glycerol uptake facilitator-like aquaporin